MKIAIFSKSIPYTYRGGIQSHVWNLSKALIRQGHEISIFTAKNIFRKQKKYIRNHIRIFTIPYLPVNIFGFKYHYSAEKTYNTAALKKMIQLNKNDKSYDIFHIQGRSGYLLAKNKKLFTPPIISTIHYTMKEESNSIYRENNISYLEKIQQQQTEKYCAEIEKQILNSADQIIAVSEEVKRLIDQQYPENQRELFIIPNGIDTGLFKPQFEDKNNFKIISVSRLVYRKRFDLLINAFSVVKKKIPAATLHIIGSGPRQNEIEKQIKNSGLSGSIFLLGELNEKQVAAEMRSAACFALASEAESQGIVFLEAMASGIPVISFDIPGVNEMNIKSNCGYLVPKGNVHKFAEAIIWLLTDSQLSGNYGKKGREIAERYYSWDQIATRTVQIYQKALKMKQDQ